MSRFSGTSDIQAVRDATDLVHLIGEHVPLKPRGREHVGLCPFHDDHSPSFAVVTHKGNAFYKCHACGASGDAIRFVMEYMKQTFPEALRYLADRAGIPLQKFRNERSDHASDNRKSLREANAFGQRYFRNVLADPTAGKIGREFIARRGISEEMVAAFQLGSAREGWDGLLTAVRAKGESTDAFVAAGLLKRRDEDQGFYDSFRNRLMFPIIDEFDHVIAFGARRLQEEDQPKYLNSSDSILFDKSKTLYGIHLAKRAIIDAGIAIITEGYTDVIACHQAGLTNVVGILGTALTSDHARLLKRWCRTVVLVLDGDEAGRRAADRAVEVFFAEPVDVKICVLPEGLDPDECLKLPDGVEQFRTAVSEARDALSYKINRFQESISEVTGLSERQMLLEQFLADLSRLGFSSLQGVRKRLVMVQLAELLHMPVQELERALPRAPQRKRTTDSFAESAAKNVAAASDRALSTRSRAERAVLSFLVLNPELAATTVICVSDHMRGVLDVLTMEMFTDDEARHLAETLLPRLANEDRPSVQELLEAVEHDSTREIVSNLYFQARDLCDDDEDRAATLLRDAAEALCGIVQQQKYEQQLIAYREPKSDLVGVERLTCLELIEARRKQGARPAAIHRSS